MSAQLTPTAHRQNNNYSESQQITGLSNEANRMIKTDQETFGNFMVSIGKRNPLESQNGLLPTNPSLQSQALVSDANMNDSVATIGARVDSLDKHPST